MRTDGGLGVAGGFAGRILDEMHLETGVSKKGPMTLLAPSGGFLAPGIGCLEIRALFLTTGPALLFLVASMVIFMVIGFPTMGTDVAGPEKSRQLGDDIVMALVMQQDQLFVLKGSKGCDVKRPGGIHQQDLVTGQGRGLTKSRQGVVAAWPEGHVGFPMQVPSEGSLQSFSMANAAELWVLVHSGFGDDEGSSTTEFIFIVNSDDRFGVPG